ncbi:hypothetical protein TYRP_017148 [Tyrophagus putrescentiae]|nr:hypothetical protein TYRP_017148 [Tyrophagus putrescentiae]
MISGLQLLLHEDYLDVLRVLKTMASRKPLKKRNTQRHKMLVFPSLSASLECVMVVISMVVIFADPTDAGVGFFLAPIAPGSVYHLLPHCIDLSVVHSLTTRSRLIDLLRRSAQL